MTNMRYVCNRFYTTSDKTTGGQLLGLVVTANLSFFSNVCLEISLVFSYELIQFNFLSHIWSELNTCKWKHIRSQMLNWNVELGQQQILKRRQGKDLYMTHSQMFQKVESDLPEKIWSLVGCTEMISWLAKL